MTFSSLPTLMPAYLPSSLAQKYDTEALSWDRKLQILGFNRTYDHLFQRMNENGLLSGLDDNANVLDIGIGTGALTIALLNNVAASPYVTGIDISHKMLGVAKKRLSRLGTRHMLLQTDICAMSGSTGCYDLVICAHVLEHLADPAACVVRIRQMLSPGGRFVLVITRCGLWGYYMQHRWNIFPATPSGVWNWFKEAGLAEITVIPLHATPWNTSRSIAITGVAV